MQANHLTRRRFLKALGAATAAAAVASRVSLPRDAHAQAARAPANGKLRFGVQTPPQHATYAEILETWKVADASGYDSAFVFDHFIPIYSDPDGPCLEGWTLLTALATQTRNVKVGVLVTGNTYRYPAVLAKMAATVDQISNGRLILGVGAAWFELEHTAYGIPFYTAGGRARRLVEAVDVMKLLFTEKKSNYNGKYYQLKDALFEPKTVQKPHPPILIGGMGPKVIQPLVARQANIWHFFVREGGPSEAKRTIANFDEICRKVGRNPAEVEKSISLRPPDLTGPAPQVRDRVQAFADAGVQHFIISLPPPYDRQLLRRFAEEVMPAFRKS